MSGAALLPWIKFEGATCPLCGAIKESESNGGGKECFVSFDMHRIAHYLHALVNYIAISETEEKA